MGDLLAKYLGSGNPFGNRRCRLFAYRVIDWSPHTTLRVHHLERYRMPGLALDAS